MSLFGGSSGGLRDKLSRTKEDVRRGIETGSDKEVVETADPDVNGEKIARTRKLEATRRGLERPPEAGVGAHDVGRDARRREERAALRRAEHSATIAPVMDATLDPITTPGDVHKSCGGGTAAPMCVDDLVFPSGTAPASGVPEPDPMAIGDGDDILGVGRSSSGEDVDDTDWLRL